ncbi:hypothetical protein [Pseudonocardia broussonetiae]|uniref:DUF3040 domain-containing protein n=1 Tax=Pseudonocardia broussonetiae TaxID=2736640 RepID=A0A6M6JPX7_9PSEU|nr:hypothetical protein [Pseudonocardia broussonetiae]QJY49300.1 hypothetical protein HOP40_29030 [Pseudonocardia broussonetiae]
MIPAHDRVRLTERERLELGRMERGLLAPSAGPTPATLLTAGLLVMVVGVVAVSPAGLFAGIGLSLTALGRALLAGR